MKKVICVLLVSSVLTGCGAMQGQDFARAGASIKYLSGSSTSRAGLNESMMNCLRDAIDPMNRGSGCN
tara:strand:+ start:564 stop:767 length:204 start_codon:yes stop_codon:yes gene_type:complete